MLTDPIADMLTRIRNANSNKNASVSMPSSTMKKQIAKILKEEGFISDYAVVTEDGKTTLTITLKYGENGERIISGLKRISKPGLRVYVKADEVLVLSLTRRQEKTTLAAKLSLTFGKE